MFLNQNSIYQIVLFHNTTHISGVKKRLESHIHNFIYSDNKFYEFPSSLFSNERRFLHQLCRYARQAKIILWGNI